MAYWTLDEASGTRADAVGGNDLDDNDGRPGRNLRTAPSRFEENPT